MISISIPGSATLSLQYLVLDYNGTIAEDGEVIPSCIPVLHSLSKELDIYVLTADTHGTVELKLKDIACELHIIGEGKQDLLKLEFIRSLGSTSVAALGNGRNDMLMLQEAALGIGLIQAEGANMKALASADLVCTDIVDALGLLLKPNRLIATMRN